jgi:hypothetical protein
MCERLLGAARALLLVGVALVLMGAADNKDKNYKAGDGEGVKGWGFRHFADAKTGGQPLCIYFYDAKNSRNMTGKFYEENLGKAEVKEKLKGFLCLKVKSDNSDGKGWPGDWMERSINGATVVLTTSDFSPTCTFIYDKFSKESFNLAGLMAQLKGIAGYEEKLKALQAKNPKPAAAPVAAEEKAPKLMPGLDADSKKPQPKKPPKKVDGPTEE